MQEQHVGTLGEIALARQIDKTGHGLARIDRVKQDAFGLSKELDGVDHGRRRQRIAGAHIVVERDNVFGVYARAGADLFQGFIGELEYGRFVDSLKKERA